MTFLLDHCIWKETEDILRKADYRCLTLQKLDKVEATNVEVIILARQHKAILITRDRDFSDLTIYPPGSHEGIIFLRISPKTMDAVHNILINALHTLSFEQLHKNLLIITSATYRLHKAK